MTVKSPIEALIQTEVTVRISGSNSYKIPLLCKVVVKSLICRARINFSSEFSCWYSLLGKPALKLSIDPQIGSENKLALKNFPRVQTFIEDLISSDMKEFCYPNKKTFNFPLTKFDTCKWPLKTAEMQTQTLL